MKHTVICGLRGECLPSPCLVAVVLDVVAIEGATTKCHALVQGNLSIVRAVSLGIAINCSRAPAKKKGLESWSQVE